MSHDIEYAMRVCREESCGAWKTLMEQGEIEIVRLRAMVVSLTDALALRVNQAVGRRHRWCRDVREGLECRQCVSDNGLVSLARGGSGG